MGESTDERRTSAAPRRAARPSVVIVGGGFGGLEAAKALKNADVDVTIIDRKNHHCFQPLLYQVATASLSPADVAWPIRSILRNQANAHVVMADVTGVDFEQRCVTTTCRPYRYDYLVLATGATHWYFGHSDWEGQAPGLKTIEDATAIRARILIAFERAELADNDAERDALLTFVIIGGGPTGVELAGSIADIARNILARDFRNIHPERARIVLVEAGPRVLPTMAEALSHYTEAELRRLGVDVITGNAVTDVQREGIRLSDGRFLASRCVLWAAGVRASPAAGWLRVDPDRAGRIRVDANLQVPGHDQVYVIGDTAAVQDQSGNVPGVASAAKQMGRYAGLRISALAAGRPFPAPFRYRNLGNLATIGRRSAVVDLGRIHLVGLPGWLFWSVVHIFFLIGARNRLIVAINWIWEYFTFQRGARLISGVDQSSVSPTRQSAPVAGDERLTRQ